MSVWAHHDHRDQALAQVRVAQGVVDAYKNVGDIDIPIIVRLQGTNAEEGAKIIEESGLKVTSAVVLKDAAEKVREAVA